MIQPKPDFPIIRYRTHKTDVRLKTIVIEKGNKEGEDGLPRVKCGCCEDLLRVRIDPYVLGETDKCFAPYLTISVAHIDGEYDEFVGVECDTIYGDWGYMDCNYDGSEDWEIGYCSPIIDIGKMHNQGLWRLSSINLEVHAVWSYGPKDTSDPPDPPCEPPTTPLNLKVKYRGVEKTMEIPSGTAEEYEGYFEGCPLGHVATITVYSDAQGDNTYFEIIQLN